MGPRTTWRPSGPNIQEQNPMLNARLSSQQSAAAAAAGDYTFLTVREGGYTYLTAMNQICNLYHK
jgi:hypothetical protein